MIDLALVADAPEWLLTLVEKPAHTPREAPENFVEDAPAAIDAARAKIEWLIRTGDLPTFGNRDDHAFRTYTMLHGIGISRDRAPYLYELLYEAGGARPDHPDDLNDMIERIWSGKTGDNPPGSELPPIASAALGAAVERHLPAKRWRLIRAGESLRAPPIEFWDEDHMLPHAPGGYVGIVVGPFSGFKTQTLLSMLFEAKQSPRILYVCGEGDAGLGPRLNGIMLAHGFDEAYMDEVWRRVDAPTVDTLDEFNTWLAEELTEQDWRPDIIVVDTLSTVLCGLEEDVRAGSMMTAQGPIGQMARRFNALVLVVHHVGWEAQSDTTGKVQYRSKGSISIESNAALTLTIHRDRKSDTIRVNRARFKDGKDGPDCNSYYEVTHLAGVPVPRKITGPHWELLTGAKKYLTAERVSSALQVLGALDIEHGVNTITLLTKLLPPGAQDPEEWQSAIEKLARTLERSGELDGLHDGKTPRLWRCG